MGLDERLWLWLRLWLRRPFSNDLKDDGVDCYCYFYIVLMMKGYRYQRRKEKNSDMVDEGCSV